MPNHDPYDDLTGLAEHEEFERGAEDQELRAMREEAERECQLEGYWHYCDEQSSVNEPALSFNDWMAAAELSRAEAAALPPPPPYDSDDDIPF